MNLIVAEPLWRSEPAESNMHHRQKTREPLVWTLLKVVFFFLLAIATPLSLVSAIIYLALNGLYSFDATSAVLLSFLILWLSSPLIVFFAYAVCSLRDRWHEPSPHESDAIVLIIVSSPEDRALRSVMDGRTDTLYQENSPSHDQNPGQSDTNIAE